MQWWRWNFWVGFWTILWVFNTPNSFKVHREWLGIPQSTPFYKFCAWKREDAALTWLSQTSWVQRQGIIVVPDAYTFLCVWCCVNLFFFDKRVSTFQMHILSLCVVLCQSFLSSITQLTHVYWEHVFKQLYKKMQITLLEQWSLSF